jgi:hypothetical protein
MNIFLQPKIQKFACYRIRAMASSLPLTEEYWRRRATLDVLFYMTLAARFANTMLAPADVAVLRQIVKALAEYRLELLIRVIAHWLPFS